MRTIVLAAMLAVWANSGSALDEDGCDYFMPDSSWIEEVWFCMLHPEDPTGFMSMETTEGREYESYDFPAEVYWDWTTAPSAGKFFNEYIRDDIPLE